MHTIVNSPRFVGSAVSREYFEFLTEGFKGVHPTEQNSVFISKEFILETLRQLPNISGVRFIYGLKEGADPSSRTVVLVPCEDSSEDGKIPNLLFLKKGYLNSEGERLSHEQCWDLFTRYVNRMSELLPDAKRKDIPRGCFFGINILEQMMSDENASGILYHFGYHPDRESLPLRYQPALSAVDHHLVAIDPPIDTGFPCPPDECGSSLGIFFLGGLVANIGDPSLTEMYHYALPPLIGTFRRSGMAEANYQGVMQAEFAACKSLVETGRSAEAGIVFKDRMEALIDRYLYTN